jgi:predicted membrane protein
MIPLLMLQLWTACIVAAISISLVTILYNLSQKRGVTSLEALSLFFGLVNAVLYFGFQSTFLLQRLGAFIYLLLLVQVILSLVRGVPWTEQYAKRSVSPELWENPMFRETNRFLTIVWGCAFLVDMVLSIAFTGWLGNIVPIALVVATAVATPFLTKWYTSLRTKQN